LEQILKQRRRKVLHDLHYLALFYRVTVALATFQMDSKTETVRSDPVPSPDKLTLCITVNDSLPDMPSVSKGEGEVGVLQNIDRI